MNHLASTKSRAAYVLSGVCAAVLLTGAAIAEFGGAEAESAPAAVPVLDVVVTPVRLQNGYRVEQSYAGRIVASRSSALGFERGGTLVVVAVDEGDRVEKGDLIARLDTRALEAGRRQALAGLDHARALEREALARLELARKDSRRKSALAEKGHLSKTLYDEALASEQALSAQLGAAAAAVTESQTRLQAIEVDIEMSVLRAPYSGSITRRLLDEGTALGAGAAVVHLIEDSALEARIGVPFDAADNLAVGETYDIQVGTRSYPGRLRAMLSEIDSQTRTLFAVFALGTGERAPLAGQIGKLLLSRRVDDRGFWLPISALTEGSRGLWNSYAVVAGANGEQRVEARQLFVLHAESERVFVRGALDDGESVVVSGLHRLVPGQRVNASRT